MKLKKVVSMLLVTWILAQVPGVANALGLGPDPGPR